MRLALGLVVVTVALAAAAVTNPFSWNPPTAHASSIQGDVDCNGAVTAVDSLNILRYVAGLEPWGDCLEQNGDVNCDGVIDALDALGILLWIAGLAPLPSEDCTPIGEELPLGPTPTPTPGPTPTPTPTPILEDPEDDEAPDPEVAVAASASSPCGPTSHTVTVQWDVANASTPVMVNVTVMPSMGPVQSDQFASLQGSANFNLALPSGGHALVLVDVQTPEGPTSDSAATDLLPCLAVVTPAPGSGFGEGDLLPPGGLDGDALEVDIAHLGGSPQGPTQTVLVMAMGSGSAYKLTSWNVPFGSIEPVLTGTSETLPGRDVKLHVLTDDISPGLTIDMVISAAIHTDGNLWLTSWRVEPDGAFTKLHSRGYGLSAGAGVAVNDFAITHRPVKNGGGTIQRFHVVTPVIGNVVVPQGAGFSTGPQLRTVTWSVHPDTGVISGLFDSGQWGAPDADTHLAVAWQSGTTFVVAHKTGGALALDHWTVATANGLPIHIGSSVSGLNLRGDGVEQFGAEEFDVAGLTSQGVVTAYRGGPATLPRMLSWETRIVACDGGCYVRPYLVGNSNESVPPPPALTDSAENGAAATARGILTDSLWEQFGVGSGQMMSVFPASPQFTSVGIASVTKNMTLLVAIDAINAGQVSLDDEVEISEDAANIGGSRMRPEPGLVEGEKQTLRTLLHGMMMHSGNDASVAIAEHVGGSQSVFVARMNLKAAELGLSNTTYNQPAGGGYSTPQDQVTLWLHAYQEPLFRDIANAQLYDACGTLNEQPKCWFLAKGNIIYPGREGWKGGRRGFTDQSLPTPRPPLCFPGRCLTAQATRMDRTLVLALQHSGDRWADAFNMWDYGFLRLFTPDMRGASTNLGPEVSDFGVARITDTLSATAIIEAGVPQVCTWTHQVDFGQAEMHDCTPVSVIALPPGPPPRSVNKMQVEWLSSLLHEGDYLTAHVNLSSRLVLTLWRVGPKEPF